MISSGRLTTRTTGLAVVVVVCLAGPAPVSAYSVLAHEANVDALWDRGIAPLLRQRFPSATADDVTAARAYAYGGSVIQDLGYYPFGSHFFSNLLHYVRSGDFVETLVKDARDVNEYAFALGALAHYTADNTGHPVAVNRAVPLMFPDLRRKFGNVVTYEESPARHVIVEFSFDVVQAAGGAYLPDAYHAFIGFEVPKPLLERAFAETYGLEMKDVFRNEDLALATYRHSVSEAIPEITRVAWRDKREEISRLTPNVTREKFVFNVDRAAYVRRYGDRYQRPGLFARFLAFLYRLLPKIGPLKPLSFKAPTPDAEQLFLTSFIDTRQRYRDALASLGAGRLDLRNMNFDTGRPTRRGEYKLADETYRDLLKRLTRKKGSGPAPEGIRRELNAFYAAPANPTRKQRKCEKEIREQLARLDGS